MALLLLSRSVSLVLPLSMACSAPTVTLWGYAGIGFVVGVPRRTVRGVRPGVSAVCDAVPAVLRMSAVCQVFKSVVRIFAVEMPNDHSTWSGSDERFEDQLVDKSRMHLVGPLDAEPHPKVASWSLRRECLKLRAVHKSAHPASVAYLVTSLVARYWPPLFGQLRLPRGFWDAVYRGSPRRYS